MLDLNSIEITKLTGEFLRNRFIYIFLGIAIIVLSILFFNKMLKSSAFNDFLIIILSAFIMFVGIRILFSKINYYKVAIKVVPNEKLTIEQIKTSDDFIEKNGDYYYVKTFKRYVLLESDRMFTSNQGRLLRETEQDFNDFVNTNWLKHNAVYIEDGVVERRWNYEFWLFL